MNHKYLKFTSALLAASTVLYPAQALADPVSVGTFIINGLITLGGAGSALAFAATSLSALTVGQIALAAGAIAFSVLTSGGSRGRIDPGKAKEEITTDETSEVQGIGIIRLSGATNFGNNKHPNMYRSILHLKGPVAGIIKTYVNGREVIKDSSDQVLSAPWATINSSTGAVTSYLKLETKLGDGTETAWSALVSDFPEFWSTDHRIRGIFQTLVTAVNPGIATTLYQKLYSVSSYPKIEYEVLTALVYDPRKDSTVSGGSGTHRADDSATWEWSDNGPLGATYMLMQYPDVTYDLIDWDLTLEQADLADVTVTTKTGTEKRSRISGVWPSMNERGSTLQQALDSIGGELVLTSVGKFYVRLVDDNPDAEVTFTENDVYQESWQSGPDGIERPNTCRVSYYSPEREYEMTEINLDGIAWAIIDDEVTRWGEKIFEIKLPFCFSASQAQRIARRMFTQARADRGSVKLDMSGMAAWGCYYADIDIMGEATRCKITSPRCNDQDGTVDLGFIKLDTLAAWNPAVDEADAPAVKPPQEDDTALATPAAPTAMFSVTLSTTAKVMRIIYSSVPSATGYLASYATVAGDGSVSAYAPMTQYSGVTVSRVNGDFIGQVLQGKVQAYDADGSSNFSDASSAITIAHNTDAPVAVANFTQNIDASSGLNVQTFSFDVVTPNIITVSIYKGKATAPYDWTLYSTAVDTYPKHFSGSTSTSFGATQYPKIRVVQTASGGAVLDSIVY